MKIQRQYFGNNELYVSYDADSKDIIGNKLSNNKMFGIDNVIDALRFIFPHDKNNNPQDTIVDCGCHIGTFTLPLYNLAKKIICIDGSESNLECLNDTLLQDEFKNIESKLCILDSCVRPCSFNDSGPFGSIVFDGELNKTSNTLNNLLKDEINISLIKYDLEGSEVNALLGSDKIINKHRPCLIVEINPSCQKGHDKSTKELLKTIKEFKYNIFLLHSLNDEVMGYINIDETHSDESYFPMGSVIDAFCIPEEKLFEYNCSCGFCFNFNNIINL